MSNGELKHEQGIEAHSVFSAHALLFSWWHLLALAGGPLAVISTLFGYLVYAGVFNKPVMKPEFDAVSAKVQQLHETIASQQQTLAKIADKVENIATATAEIKGFIDGQQQAATPSVAAAPAAASNQSASAPRKRRTATPSKPWWQF